MKPKPFPEIPGVTFKLLDRWPGYAVATDGSVWNGKGGKWRKMEPYPFHDGDMVVALQVGRATFVKKVKELLGALE